MPIAVNYFILLLTPIVLLNVRIVNVAAKSDLPNVVQKAGAAVNTSNGMVQFPFWRHQSASITHILHGGKHIIEFNNNTKRREYYADLLNGGQNNSHKMHIGAKESSKGATTMAMAPMKGKQKRAVYAQEELNYYDEVWVGEITIGTPAVTFFVQFDSGSANLWIPDMTCSACSGKNEFNSAASSSYARDGSTFTIYYGSGWTYGYLGRDTVTILGIGGFQSLSIPSTTFGQATQVSSYFYSGRPYDGYFGLGFQSLAANGVVPPLQNALNQGLLGNPLFEVYLTTAAPQYQQYPAASWSGYYTFGGMDTTHCATHSYVPLLSNLYYAVQIQRVNVGTAYSNCASGTAMFDTGTALIVGKQAAVAPIAAAVGATYSSSLGVYIIPCTASYTPVTFTIGNIAYSLPSTVLSMNYGGLGTGQCLFGIYYDDALMQFVGQDWILGTVFHRQFCVLYNIQQGQLGIAAHAPGY